MELSDFFTLSGRSNSAMLREENIRKRAPEFYQAVESYVSDHGIFAQRFVEKLWYFFNRKEEAVACKKIGCSAAPKFIGLKEGFLAYCSLKCSNSDQTVKAKKEEACLTRFGKKNPYQSARVMEKIKRTNLARHGVENPMRSDQVKSQMKARSLQKNGTEWALSKGGKAYLNKIKNLRDAFEQKYDRFKILEYSDEKFGVCTFVDPECGHTFQLNKWQAHQRSTHKVKMCSVCNPIGSFNQTVRQEEMKSFLTSIGEEFIEFDRSVLGRMELDFYLPKRRIAIELDGLYWHSLEFKDPKYHLRKTQACEEKGLTLIHVFEDEWNYRRTIVKSRILNILGKSENRVFARQCKVRKVSSREAHSFLEENHLQGAIPSSHRYGLEYDGTLVSVMTFGAYRRSLGRANVSGQFEMYRFCNRVGWTVPGGASRLFSEFTRDVSPSSVISYADRRWSQGGLYVAIGFKLESTTSPNFWWIDGDRRSHRFKFTKREMLKRLGREEGDSADLESELGLMRIYDSGNLRFIWTSNQTSSSLG